MAEDPSGVKRLKPSANVSEVEHLIMKLLRPTTGMFLAEISQPPVTVVANLNHCLPNRCDLIEIFLPAGEASSQSGDKLHAVHQTSGLGAKRRAKVGWK
ncbi:MAG: hypothetical protein EXS31_15970 [Pedosphaera sp.]|nr:hypothetical protein [Pedosphaera sp.]